MDGHTGWVEAAVKRMLEAMMTQAPETAMA